MELEKLEFKKAAGLVLKDMTYCECVFKGINLTAESRFVNVTFDDCVFEKCDFSNIKFVGCHIKTARFLHCKLVGIDWSSFVYSAFFSEIVFDECILNYGCFIGLKVKQITIKNSICKEADFEQAVLPKSDFFGTDFLGSRFVNTDLREANFLNAKNYRIDPSLNNIKKAIFSFPDVSGLLECLDIVIRPRQDMN